MSQVHETTIVPAQVTKPIQLLAAWLVGMIAVIGSFLGAASLISNPSWAPGALVCAAIMCVPVFLFCLFLLQTKFRPEMQEDSYYSKHLERKYSEQTQTVTTIRHVEPVVVSSKESLPRISNRIKASRFISINDLMSNYDEIKRALASVGLRAANTFGSNSVSGEAPEKFIISVGESTPTMLARQVISALKDTGLQGIGIGIEEVDRQSIYIGAYSYDDNDGYLSVNNPDFKKLLDSETTDRTFFRLLRKYDHEALEN